MELGGHKKRRYIWPKIYFPRKLLYFVNRPNAESPKIGQDSKKKFLTKNGILNKKKVLFDLKK